MGCIDYIAYTYMEIHIYEENIYTILDIALFEIDGRTKVEEAAAGA